MIQCETKASETELKFAGFRMGMTKDEVVSNQSVRSPENSTSHN